MPWLRLTIATGADQVEQLSDLLEQFNACSVSYAPSSHESRYDIAYPAEPQYWQETQVTALFDPDIDMDILLACIRNRIGTGNIHKHSIEPLPDADWTETYKTDFHTMTFADRLIIMPSWEKVETGDLAVITLEPGLAFGTGRHATTALCLEWLAAHDLTGKTVIDYGCGSGILALAAARLGAVKVFAVDIDPQALSATRQNAERNRLQDRIEVSDGGDIRLPKVEILIANLLFKPLLELAQVFAGLVIQDGKIVLSGILASQVQDCLVCYERWFKMEPPEFRDAWSLLHGSR